jgi:ABC-type sulfate/molybdate transport systems ATPase subunit
VVTALRLRELVLASAGTLLRVSVEVDRYATAAVTAEPATATALARTVVGLAAARGGQILTGERDVTALPPARRQIGYVPAGAALLPHLTVQDNIGYAVRRREMVRSLTADWLAEIVSRLDLRTVLGQRPHQLPAGLRLRAAIARAAAWLPEVLVVDLPAPVDGVPGMAELPELVSPEWAPGAAVLVCSADEEVLAGIDRRVAPERVPA